MCSGRCRVDGVAAKGGSAGFIGKGVRPVHPSSPRPTWTWHKMSASGPTDLKLRGRGCRHPDGAAGQTFPRRSKGDAPTLEQAVASTTWKSPTNQAAGWLNLQAGSEAGVRPDERRPRGRERAYGKNTSGSVLLASGW